MVGVPEGSLDLPVFPLLMGNIHVGGSAIGSPTEVQQMFALVKAKGIKPWIERRSFDDINACVKDAKDGRARSVPARTRALASPSVSEADS